MRYHRGFSLDAMILIFALAALSGAPHGLAEGGKNNNFFPVNSALTIFGDKITKNDAAGYQILKEKKSEDQPEQAPHLAIEDVKPETAPPAPEAVETKNYTPSTPEEIIAKYGDPKKDAPVLAQKDAPLPFQAFMAALEIGDEQLARKYARQYVRYMRKLNEQVTWASKLQQEEMVKEGILDSEGSPENLEMSKLAEAMAEEEALPADKISSTPINLKSLDPKAKELIKLALEAEEKKQAEAKNRSETFGIQVPAEEESKALAVKSKDTPEVAKQRLLARKSFAGRVPVDPKGEVEFYFFLRTQDQKSQLMGRDVQAFYEKVKDNPRIKVHGLTIEVTDHQLVGSFRGRTGAEFLIANGKLFAKELKVDTAPTLVAVAKNSGRAVIERGLRKEWYLDELFKHMSGGMK